MIWTAESEMALCMWGLLICAITALVHFW